MPHTPTTRRAPDRGRSLLGPALELVHTGRAPTRSALTAALGVTRATAGAVAGELAALGLVTVDQHPIGSSRGRPSHRLDLAPDGPVVLAAQLHADGLTVALAGLGGSLGEPVRHPLPARTDPASVIGAIAEAGAELIRADHRRCLGAALALPNPVREPEGTAPAALTFGWPGDTPAAALFAAAMAAQDLGPRARRPLPTAVANDANLAALAEHRHGAGRDARHLLLVTSGHRGVGGALVVDGRLHTGSAGLALEVGHLTVDPLGRPCPCGNRGCLNVETDPAALLAAAGRPSDPTGQLLDQARELTRTADRDPAARAAVHQVVDRLALGLAGLANILNPDRIVLAGLHRDLLAAAPDRLPEAVIRHSLWGRCDQVPIAASALAHGGLVGAAELAWGPYLADPQGVAG
ncbi:putative NBD/HSP70 family sugar kinase [Kitasatospora sp. GAS204A]|uniref:ROK family protein n=1 Tax=unclassified Kitasatospora TaxID=2633591 RepID=UPI0024771246|nr:ROK family protein [Kitasatospora sp. GAS204B]MDH6122213.1 putative NBD/HSP70 family sugar kinase [Kitasatospora sp. GAS204B]